MCEVLINGETVSLEWEDQVGIWLRKYPSVTSTLCIPVRPNDIIPTINKMSKVLV